jgi:hypothetical protein
MKRLSAVIAAVLLSFGLLAQGDGDPKVASRHRPGIMWFYTGLKPAGRNSGPKYDRFMIDLDYNSFVKDSMFLNAKPLSIGFNFHLMFDIPLAPKNTVGLGIGLSFRHQRISFDGMLQRNTESRSTQLLMTPAGAESPEKSVFASDAFAIPVELRFRTPNWSHVKLHVGAHAGIYTRTYTKTRFAGTDTDKSRDFFDADRFFYGVHARFGLRNWALFADYSLRPQFKSPNSTNLHAVSFGITCSVF